MQASGAIAKTLGLKPDVAAYPCSPAPRMWSRENKELKVSLSYIGLSGLQEILSQNN